MEQISSRSIFFSKRVFPLFWFGFLGFMIVMMLHSSQGEGGPPSLAIFFPLGMMAFGFFLFKKMLWDLADQVWDAGDYVVVRFGSEQERIPLSNIINVSYAYMMNPSRVTLTLQNACRFGDEVSFSPPQSFIPFAKSPIIADLIRRVDAARRA